MAHGSMNMGLRCRSIDFLIPFFLTLMLYYISVCHSFRLNDPKSKIRRVPFVKVKPDVGYLRSTDIDVDFDSEVKTFNFRERRSTGDTKISQEYELKGDNHTVAFLHWSGNNSPVIYIYTCKTVLQTKSGDLACEGAYFWRSVDYGSTFHREDQLIAKKPISISDVAFCPSKNQKVIISDAKDKMLYISENEGKQFSSVPVSTFSPSVLSCNPANDNWLVAHDLTTQKLYYSSDGGKMWVTLQEQVLSHAWATSDIDGSLSTLFMEVQKSTYTSVLKYVKIPFDPKNVKFFDENLDDFISYSLKVEGKYVFVQKNIPSKGQRLFVFYKNNSESSKNFFQAAHFPLSHVQKSYTIVDASEGEVMVAVEHKGFSNLYVSDVTGLKYSLSLENILTDRHPLWGLNTTIVDIHRVRSLNGTYLANVLNHNDYGPSVRSVISFNKGGEWHFLRAPELDHSGKPTKCLPPRCSLHIHMDFSKEHYYIPTVLSSASAVGLIIAQGNIGQRLGNSIGVFLSRDGGLTWTKEFDKYYDFTIGDHGGIITAVQMRNESTRLWYSCTEGKEWKSVILGSKPVHVFGMVTEPGETTLIFNVFGHYAHERFQWLSVKLNFTSVLSEKCTPENYTYWSPNDERADGLCLLGQHMVYERRKADDCCFNGREYERKFNITSCVCGADDFDCDFGYKHHELEEVCVATSSAVIVPEVCPEGNTYQHTHGYRKVSGDRCKGGIEAQLMPVTRLCPVKSPGELEVKFTALNRTASTGKPIQFHLSQLKGSKKSTWYSWNFGDGSEAVNATGLANAKIQSHVFMKHGQFILSVTAANKAGQSMTSTSIYVLDPIINVEIEPPYAVIAGEEALFNISLLSNHTKEEGPAEYGFVHFMWIFENNVGPPVLTLDRNVSHVFDSPGKFEVSVTAISVIGKKDAHATITVYKVLTTVRLSFDVALDKFNKQTRQWRVSFAQLLKSSISSLLQIDQARLEVAVLSGLPTTADVSIIPGATNKSKTRQEIVDKLKLEVNAGNVEVRLLPGQVIRVTHVEVLPDRGIVDVPTPIIDYLPSKGSKLAVVIGVTCSLVVVGLVIVLVYFFRRYHSLQMNYTRLRLASEGDRLRDPLMQDQDDEEDEGLQPQPGGSFRYVPVTSNSAGVNVDSDEELLDGFRGGPLVVMPNGPAADNAQNT